MNSSPIKILLIEDNPQEARLVHEILSESDMIFELEHKNRLKTGIKYLQEVDTHIVLLDLTLPDGNGLDAFVKMQFQKLAIPIIILTGLDDVNVATTAIRAGAQDYVVKENMSSDNLVRAIRYAIERKNVECALENSRASFHSIVEKNADGILIIDQEGIVQFVNPAASFFLSRDKANLLNQKLEYLLDDDPLREINIQIKNGKGGIGEIQRVQTDWKGEKSYLVTIRDITARKELDKLKDEFISNVSHELRTPLTSIRESVSQVLDGILGKITEKQKKFLSVCLKNTDRLKRLVDNLLDIAKIEAGEFELKSNRWDMAELVDNVISSFTPMAQNKGLEIRSLVPNHAINISGDRDQIFQVFNNLLGNSFKFTETGLIEITVVEKKKWIECSVADTGKGIAQDELPKVFNKFQQFGRIDGPGERGTGLGLPIVKGIIELHRGKIRVESKANIGTKFTFTLPKHNGGLS